MMQNMKMDFRQFNTKIIIFMIVLCILNECRAQQQYFRKEPKDVKVHEGGEALLECQVGNQAGQVQWTKDGFALGFETFIPGFPRYSMIGDRTSGVYNLKIMNATLDDDAEFQCQVGPSKYHKPIRAYAHLSVISPPSVVEIEGHTGSKIEIQENKPLTLECVARNAKPPPTIVWYRGHVELKLGPETREDVTTEVSDGGRVKRYNVVSRISLQPTAEDDYTDYTCEARHEALAHDIPLRVTVQLSVLYPPGAPYIEGYTEGETIRRGQTVELACRSRGGNPAAQLIWYKNDEQIQMAYRSNGRFSENVYSFTADATDNHAKYRCEASNVMSTKPLRAEVELSVLFAPAHVTISGATESRVGDPVTLTCTTANSNPPAEIKWMVGTRQVRNATSRTFSAPDGGWITISNITTTVRPDRRSLVVICHGMNTKLTENVIGTHTINVLFPPGEPSIQGYTEGVAIAAGTVQKLACISMGGNPLATLTWYKNDKKIHSTTKKTERAVSAEVSIIANETDNEARYRCEATNSATEIPLSHSITLDVHFPPDNVKIRQEPKKLKPGERATLTCEASASHPPAHLSWWRAGIPVNTAPGASTNSTKPGLHGGKVSTSTLTLDIDPDMNGVVYTCQAANEELQRSVNDAITLNIVYKPVFEGEPAVGLRQVTAVDGEAAVIQLNPRANPPDLTYTWSKDGHPLPQTQGRILADGSALNISTVMKDDAGTYALEAVNSEGSQTAKIVFSVHYPPVITEINKSVLVSEAEDATLSCTAEGNPLLEAHFSWKREGFDFVSRTTISFRNGTTYLRIIGPTTEDMGAFECVVNNGVGDAAVSSTYLLVKHKPKIDTSPAIAKAAANAGDAGRLICRAQGAPKLSFKWSHLGAALPVNNSDQYSEEITEIDLLTYESILTIRKVRPADYGSYECVSRNEMGFATVSIKLEVTSAPDPPVALTVLNVTHDSIKVSWKPGFNGGLQQNFRLRYRKTNTDGFHYVDVTPTETTHYTITGLSLNTEYSFSVMARNRLGASTYLSDNIRAKTSSEAPPSSPPKSEVNSSSTGSSTTSPSSRMPPLVLVIGVGICVVLLVLPAIVGLWCCVRRRRIKTRLLTGVSPQAEREKLLKDMLEQQGDLPRIVIIAVSATASLLVIINVILVLCFIQRKRRKHDEQAQQGVSEQGSSKSATIEMYAPSSFNETVTGETLSSISEKSETYSNGEANEEFIEAGSKRAASTYLIDQVEPPAQYAYRPPPPQLGSASNTLTRHKPAPIPPQELDEQAVYVDSLRRNVYNHTLGDKSSGGYNTPPPVQQLTPTDHMHPLAEPAYYIAADARYIPYPPPPGGFGRPVGNGTLRHMVPPPDVTMSVHHHPATPHQHINGPIPAPNMATRSNGPMTPPKMPSNVNSTLPHLSTFNPNMGHHHPPVSTATAEIRSLETEGHLV